MALQLVEDLIECLHRAEALDTVAKPLSKAVARAIPHGPVKDALSGTWLGHPLHPMLTDVAIGAWTSAFVLDALNRDGTEAASDALVGVGVVSALPTAVAGLSDWSDLMGAERRVGLVHAGANVAAVGCYGLSWLARRRGARGRGVALSLLGATVATVGGYLGAHLSYRQGVNVDRNAWAEGPDDWVEVGDADAVANEGEPVAVSAGEMVVLLVRQGDAITAIGDVCGHAGGPLHEGEIDDGCVTCPWHASTFRLSDGAVVHGPATAHQPAFDTRIQGGRVLVRRRA
ncbi:MAG: Rieske 2Fe-2S domain-containing protein [Acidimicrobiales bacterium]